MTTIVSDRRKQFMEDTFPHLDSLWQCALWLTLHSSLAEELVLKTVARSYREWYDSDISVNRKVRLFRILTRESFGFGMHRRRGDQPGALSEDAKSTAGSAWGIPPDTISAIDPSHLQLLDMISYESVQRAMARLRPLSRLVTILLFRERFSYADIACITDLSTNSVRRILARLRTVIPKYILENARNFNGETESQSVYLANGAQFVRDHKSVPRDFPFTPTREGRADAAGE